jgi:hypothetical protein
MIAVCQTIKQKPDEVGRLVCDLIAEGRIVSIFDKTVNILIPQRLLVSLVERHSQMTAMSVRCPAVFDGLRSRRLKLRVGDTACIKPGRLTIGGLRIDLTTARRFQGMVNRDLTCRFDSVRISAFDRVLSTVGRRDGLLGLIDGKLSNNPFAQKGLAMCNRMVGSPRSRMAENLAEFVGLGVGFTPSGDDLICGFLLGQKVCTMSAWERKSHRRESLLPPLDEAEKDIIWRSANRTNDGGRTLIWMALQNRFPGFLLDAASGLAKAEETAAIARVVGAAVSRGHTSGTDALVGLLLYLQRFNQN